MKRIEIKSEEKSRNINVTASKLKSRQSRKLVFMAWTSHRTLCMSSSSIFNGIIYIYEGDNHYQQNHLQFFRGHYSAYFSTKSDIPKESQNLIFLKRIQYDLEKKMLHLSGSSVLYFPS